MGEYRSVDYCGSYREISLSDLKIDKEKLLSLTDAWGVSITENGMVRIPLCYYDDIRALLSSRR